MNCWHMKDLMFIRFFIFYPGFIFVDSKSFKNKASFVFIIMKEIVVGASVLKRASAFVIDLLIIDFVIGFPFTGLVERLSPKNPFDLFTTGANPGLTEIGIIISLISVLYFSILEYKIGQTAGKILMNIYVVDDYPNHQNNKNDNDKGKLFFNYIIRSLFLIPIIPFVFFWIIDPIYLAFNKDQKRFLEVLSHTKTVMKVSI